MKLKFDQKEPVMAQKKLMTPDAVRRIQSATAKANGGQVPKGSFAARAQRVVASNTDNGNKGGKTK